MSRRNDITADTPFDIAFKLKTMGINKVALSFSAGKDSLACWIALRKEKIEVIPVYNYIYPDLDFFEEPIRAYEKIFDTPIHRIPHTTYLDIYKHLLFVDPYTVRLIEIIGTNSSPPVGKITKDYLESIGHKDIMVAKGLKVHDGSIRRLAITKSGPINLKGGICYPCAYASDRMVLEMLRAEKIPLPKTYKFFSESLDVLKPSMIDYVKEFYPQDWEKIMTIQPLLELEKARLMVGKN